MAYIGTIEPDAADGILKNEFKKAIRRSGKVYNILKVMSQNPAALRDSMRFYLTIMHGESGLTRAQREMLAVVVSRANHCHY